MLGRTVVPLNNGKLYRVRACLSLATNSPGPAVLVEFVLANQANPAQQLTINQTWVQTRNAWQYLVAPCFLVPRDGQVWDALIVRAGQLATAKYPIGQVFIDNVNICCCNQIVVGNPNTNPTLSLSGPGLLQFSPNPGSFAGAMSAGEFMDDVLLLPPIFLQKVPMGFFRYLSPEMDTSECDCYP